jgi:hypothetical protein
MSTGSPYTKRQPCNNCPYRKDAPLAHWSIEEFKQLLEWEDSQLGTVYGCHKKDGSVCIGWLMNQDERDFPSIMLRISLSRHGITREYLDSLTCPSERFDTVQEMCAANFPELLNHEPPREAHNNTSHA